MRRGFYGTGSRTGKHLKEQWPYIPYISSASIMYRCDPTNPNTPRSGDMGVRRCSARSAAFKKRCDHDGATRLVNTVIKRCSKVNFYFGTCSQILEQARYGTVPYCTVAWDTVRYGTVRYDKVRYERIVLFCAVRYGMFQCSNVPSTRKPIYWRASLFLANINHYIKRKSDLNWSRARLAIIRCV